MKCPMCMKTMSCERIQDASFYLCTDCRGVWIQVGQLAQLAKSIDPSDLLMKSRKSNEDVGTSSVKMSVNCPQCAQLMTNHQYAFDSGIMIDRCDRCGAIWLDAEKIFHIKRHLADSVPQTGESAGLLGKPWQDGLLTSAGSWKGGFAADFLAEVIVVIIGELLD